MEPVLELHAGSISKHNEVLRNLQRMLEPGAAEHFTSSPRHIQVRRDEIDRSGGGVRFSVRAISVTDRDSDGTAQAPFVVATAPLATGPSRVLGTHVQIVQSAATATVRVLDDDHAGVFQVCSCARRERATRTTLHIPH